MKSYEQRELQKAVYDDNYNETFYEISIPSDGITLLKNVIFSYGKRQLLYKFPFTGNLENFSNVLELFELYTGIDPGEITVLNDGDDFFEGVNYFINVNSRDKCGISIFTEGPNQKFFIRIDDADDNNKEAYYDELFVKLALKMLEEMSKKTRGR